MRRLFVTILSILSCFRARTGRFIPASPYLRSVSGASSRVVSLERVGMNRKPVILARSADPEAQPPMRRAYTRRKEEPQCAVVILLGFAAAFALFVWVGLKIADWEIEQEAIGESALSSRRFISV